MDLGLADKAVLVTGASSGIGEAAARAFAREGARVAIVARRADVLERVATALRAAGARDAHALVGDVSVADDVARVVAQARDRLGALHVVVANAGGPPSGPFLELTDAQWREGHERTLMSVVRLARAAIPIMRAQRWGRIVTVSSVAARQPIDGLVISNTLRAGLSGLARTIANDFGRDGITIHNVLPGFTATARLDDLAKKVAAQRGTTIDAVKQAWADETPAGRLAQPDEIAHAIVFLASEAAAYMNGQSVLVDGGLMKAVD